MRGIAESGGVFSGGNTAKLFQELGVLLQDSTVQFLLLVLRSTGYLSGLLPWSCQIRPWLTPDIPAASYAADPRALAIAGAAVRLNELRENWLNPSNIVRREPECVPGYPDRILPVDGTAAAELARRTLTNLYNQRPTWLDHAHLDLDEAVADAYGWGEELRSGKLPDSEILARLFRLNQERV